MARIHYRANLNSQHFPFLSRYQGETIIVPRQDQAFENNVVLTGNEPTRDKGIPQVYYCHNVMPTPNGFQSVGTTPRVNGLPGVTDFSNIFVLRDINENKFLYSPTSKKHYVFDGTVGHWTQTSTQPISSSALVTVAYLNGNTYIFFSGVGMFQYNSTTKLLAPVALTGVTASLLNGICASNGFLIAWDNFNVYRSQATSPLNFTPDVTLGSGSSIPGDIGGQIVVCLPINNGFIIYTTKNAIGAAFTQNIRYPFTYKEVAGSAGIQSPTHVTWQDNSGFHYAWTIAGFQKVDKSAATLVFPEIGDFIADKVFEDFNPATNTFSTTKILQNFILKLTTVGKRFFVVSYGVSEFTHAFVYDILLKRWGRIKQTHVAVFDYYIPNLFGDVTWTMLGLANLNWNNLGTTAWQDLKTGVDTFERDKETLAFLQKDGTITTVNFDVVHVGDTGVLILGKYQYVRGNFLILDELRVENVDETVAPPNFTVTDLPTIDGKNHLTPVGLYPVNSGTLNRDFLCQIEGRNHSLVFYGTFHFSSLVLEFHLGAQS